MYVRLGLAEAHKPFQTYLKTIDDTVMPMQSLGLGCKLESLAMVTLRSMHKPQMLPCDLEHTVQQKTRKKKQKKDFTCYSRLITCARTSRP